MINKIFAKQIGRNVKAYINDIIVKSEKANKHIEELEVVFDVLRKFGVKLNPKKVCLGL